MVILKEGWAQLSLPEGNPGSRRLLEVMGAEWEDWVQLSLTRRQGSSRPMSTTLFSSLRAEEQLFPVTICEHPVPRHLARSPQPGRQIRRWAAEVQPS